MAENNTYWKVADSRWDKAAVIFAVLVSLLEMVLLFAKPRITFFGTSEIITQGFLAFGLLTGALLWALVELMTPARRHYTDLIFRFFGSFIIGFFIGAYLAYFFNFGQYIIVPIYSGNVLALFETFGIFFVFIVLVSDAAWAHNKTFLNHKYRKNMKKASAFLPLFAFHFSAAATSSSSSYLSTIFNSLWGILSGFIGSIVGDLETLSGDIFGGFGDSVVTSFQTWSASLGSQGIWLPITFVAVIGVAIVVGYFFLDAIGIERDALRGEEDI